MTNTAQCRNCEGTGEIDPEGHLDHDDPAALLTELTNLVTSSSTYGLRGADRADRLHALVRIGFVASRMAWLETVEMRREGWQAEYGSAIAEAAAAGAADTAVPAGAI